MKDKHTPGPWIVAEDQIGDDDGNVIADVTSYNEWNTTEGIVTKEMPWEANARLIVAAPEMLEFLRDAMGLIYGLIVHSDGQTKFQEDEKQKIAATLLRDGLDILTKIEGNTNE